MNITFKPTKLSAFLAGVATGFIVEGLELLEASCIVLLDTDFFIQRIVASIIVISYMVSMFFFVCGPLEWDRYRWVPVDGIIAGFVRGLSWFAGGAIALLLLRYLTTLIV